MSLIPILLGAALIRNANGLRRRRSRVRTQATQDPIHPLNERANPRTYPHLFIMAQPRRACQSTLRLYARNRDFEQSCRGAVAVLLVDKGKQREPHHGRHWTQALGHRRRIYPLGKLIYRSLADLARDRLHPQCRRYRGARSHHHLLANREPIGPYRIAVAPRRTLHLRFNHLSDPAPVPCDTDYSSVFESNVPIVVQHTRMDTRKSEISLLSTTTYSES
jgi:hypothetical protein